MKNGFRMAGVSAMVLVAAALAGCGGKEEAATALRPVWVVQPQAGGAGAALAFPGEVHAREESPLSFRVGGKLVRRAVDAGARVEQGQVLAELDPADQALQAQAAQAQLAAAEAELARSKGDLDRYAKLVEQQLVSRSTYDAQKAAYEAAAGQARAARAQRDVTRNQAGYTELRAPRAGVIASRQAEAGQVVAAGQTIFVMAADGGREVAIDLPEDRIRQFKVGDTAQVELWSAPGQRLPGTIREIAAAADAQTRSFAARVALDAAAQGEVELGQSARVYLPQSNGDASLHVPLSALQRGEDGAAAVWVVREGKALRVPVDTGKFGSESVPVTGALQAGDWVVAAGGHLLREGEPVAPVDRENRPVAVVASKPKAD
ncbi:efflux RND transporter periplasmic adaptor subunit [Pseudoxanthomonas daejeonensis]|uniref:efflux RND transporter periplasmic adaptor subunit n=1 Tax=Pseudoxanthomonas daejeonensis TaxID=266062 RepID=UPI001F53EC6C|nr:efflux RND transporter periplasmic adaptor subunit [Pseudoxanthomonas daejeonensis]UNK58262.1 efflux RND transporter periplasmic adaptor subunit [Pseudoxanthomonas daejeonensis]